MELFGFESETLLDLTVNVIPLGIMVFFIGLFAILPAFGVEPVITTIQFALIAVPFVGLALVSYYAGKAIQADEAARETA
jgi:hypothetical protein